MEPIGSHMFLRANRGESILRIPEDGERNQKCSSPNTTMPGWTGLPLNPQTWMGIAMWKKVMEIEEEL